MISITVNGDPVEMAESATVKILLEKIGVAGKRIAVELNGDIVPGSLHGTTNLNEGDILEVIQAIGGG